MLGALAWQVIYIIKVRVVGFWWGRWHRWFFFWPGSPSSAVCVSLFFPFPFYFACSYSNYRPIISSKKLSLLANDEEKQGCQISNPSKMKGCGICIDNKVLALLMLMWKTRGSAAAQMVWE